MVKFQQRITPNFQQGTYLKSYTGPIPRLLRGTAKRHFILFQKFLLEPGWQIIKIWNLTPPVDLQSDRAVPSPARRFLMNLFVEISGRHARRLDTSGVPLPIPIGTVRLVLRHSSGFGTLTKVSMIASWRSSSPFFPHFLSIAGPSSIRVSFRSSTLHPVRITLVAV